MKKKREGSVKEEKVKGKGKKKEKKRETKKIRQNKFEDLVRITRGHVYVPLRALISPVERAVPPVL